MFQVSTGAFLNVTTFKLPSSQSLCELLQLLETDQTTMEEPSSSPLPYEEAPKQVKHSRQDYVVAEDGDIILALPNQYYVRASSSVLSCASRAFKALLGPNFEEGQAIRSGASPKEIALSDDDEDAMASICDMLHLRTSPAER